MTPTRTTIRMLFDQLGIDCRDTDAAVRAALLELKRMRQDPPVLALKLLAVDAEVKLRAQELGTQNLCLRAYEWDELVRFASTLVGERPDP